MTKRSSLIALAALATLGLSALTPTDASAFGWRGGGYHVGHFGHFGHFGYGYGWHPGGGYNFHRTYWGYRWWPHSWYPRWRFFPRPVVVGGGVIGGGAAYAAAAPTSAPAAGPAPQAAAPQCLTKNYLPNGTVVFADMCTQEQAVGPTNGEPPQGQPGAH